jgi:hypothetical protein
LLAHSIANTLIQDPNKPKRAMSAFFLYSQANRQRTKEANPNASFGEIVSCQCARYALEIDFCDGFERLGQEF